MVYVFALFAWFAFVLLGVGLIVALESVWNRDARDAAAHGAVGCGPRVAPQGRAASSAPRRRRSARPLSPRHELRAA